MMNRAFISAALLCGLFHSPLLSATITGVLVHHGRLPQSPIPVSLMAINQHRSMEPTVIQSVKTRSSFRFLNLAPQKGETYLVRAEWEGAVFVSSLVQWKSKSQQISLKVHVYPPSLDRSPISIKTLRMHVIPETQAGKLRVYETIELHNASETTIVPVSTPIRRPSVELPIPMCAEQLQLDFKFQQEEVSVFNESIQLFIPLPPGLSRFSLSYNVSYSGRSATFELLPKHPVQQFTAIIPETTSISGLEHLHQKSRKYYDGINYRNFTADVSNRLTPVRVRIDGLSPNLQFGKWSFLASVLLLILTAGFSFFRPRHTQMAYSFAPTARRLFLISELVRMELRSEPPDPRRKKELLNELIALYDGTRP